MSDNRGYKIRFDGEPVEGFGPYRDEDRLIDDLLQIDQSADLGAGKGVVHVYETDASPLGIGRRYLVHIDVSTVLMTGEVNEDRVRNS